MKVAAGIAVVGLGAVLAFGSMLTDSQSSSGALLATAAGVGVSAEQASLPCTPSTPGGPVTNYVPVSTDTPVMVAARALIAAGATGDTLLVLTAVAGPESGYNPLATNPSGASGLWQIMLPLHQAQLGGGDWRDPGVNARAAMSIFGTEGFGAWTTWTSDAYRPYLPGAQSAITAVQTGTPGGGPGGTPGPTDCGGSGPTNGQGYAFPFVGWGLARTDQGVDFLPPAITPVRAIGDGVVTFSTSQSGWPFGGFITYQLTGGDHAGLFVFTAEHIIDLAPVGTRVTAGTPIATALPGYPFIETGWAAGATGASPAVSYNGLPDGTPTTGGLAFARFLRNIGGTTLQDPGPGPDRP